MPVAHEVIRNQRSRGADGRYGSGQFGSSRDHGTRHHLGLDIITLAGEPVYSPISGYLTREAFPYKDDHSLTGVVLRGAGEWLGFEVRIFYTEGLLCGNVAAGQQIGFAQNLQDKYPGITNHIHVEVRRGATVLPPSEIFAQCF